MAMTAITTYRCPDCGRVWKADRPLWRCACGSHLNLTPGRGLARGEIASGEASLWRYAAALALRGPPRVSARRGLDPARHARLARGEGSLQARIANVDRLVQGPRHRRHDQPSARG